jgi:hypothetical protein
VLNGLHDDMRADVRAAVDEDARVLPPVLGRVKRCTYFDCGHCRHTEGPSNGCTGWGNCDWFTAKR